MMDNNWASTATTAAAFSLSTKRKRVQEGVDITMASERAQPPNSSQEVLAGPIPLSYLSLNMLY